MRIFTVVKSFSRLLFVFSLRDQVSHPFKIIGINTFIWYILNFMFLYKRFEKKIIGVERVIFCVLKCIYAVYLNCVVW